MKACTSTTCSRLSSSLQPPLPFPFEGRGPAPISVRHSGATRVGAALGPRGNPVAVVRRLAAEGHHTAGAQHAPELAEGGGEIRQVVEHRVPEDEVERVVLERQLLGLARGGLHGQLELGRGALELASIPGEMSVATASPITPARSRLSEK